MLTSLTQMLAAGHLLTRSYGTGAEGTNKDGKELKAQARDMLKQIMDSSLVLVDAAGVQVATSTGDIATSVEYETGYRPATFSLGDRY